MSASDNSKQEDKVAIDVDFITPIGQDADSNFVYKPEDQVIIEAIQAGGGCFDEKKGTIALESCDQDKEQPSSKYKKFAQKESKEPPSNERQSLVPFEDCCWVVLIVIVLFLLVSVVAVLFSIISQGANEGSGLRSETKISSSAPSETPSSSLSTRQPSSLSVPLLNYCGATFAIANRACAVKCPLGKDAECPDGERCFADVVACAGTGENDSEISKVPTMPPSTLVATTPPQATPTMPTDAGLANDNELLSFCGFTFGHAESVCAVQCPTGTNADCPSGQRCFADVEACKDADSDDATSLSPSTLPTSFSTSTLPTPISTSTLPTPISTSTPPTPISTSTPPTPLLTSTQPTLIPIPKMSSSLPIPIATPENSTSLPTPTPSLPPRTSSPTTAMPPLPLAPTMRPSSPRATSTTANYCGYSFQHASGNCETACPSGLSTECPPGQGCFANVTLCPTTVPPPQPPSSRPPTSTNQTLPANATAHFCGASYALASDRCAQECRSGLNSECDVPGEGCFAAVISCTVGSQECDSVAGYRFAQHVDSFGLDLENMGRLAPANLGEECDLRPDCVGFNTNGWLKMEIRPLDQLSPFAGGDTCNGLYIKCVGDEEC